MLKAEDLSKALLKKIEASGVDLEKIIAPMNEPDREKAFEMIDSLNSWEATVQGWIMREVTGNR